MLLADRPTTSRWAPPSNGGKHSLSSQADPRRQEPRPTLRAQDTLAAKSDCFGARPRFSLRPYANRRPRAHPQSNTRIASALAPARPALSQRHERNREPADSVDDSLTTRSRRSQLGDCRLRESLRSHTDKSTPCWACEGASAASTARRSAHGGPARHASRSPVRGSCKSRRTAGSVAAAFARQADAIPPQPYVAS